MLSLQEQQKLDKANKKTLLPQMKALSPLNHSIKNYA
jgi:hypothetical protein